MNSLEVIRIVAVLLIASMVFVLAVGAAVMAFIILEDKED